MGIVFDNMIPKLKEDTMTRMKKRQGVMILLLLGAVILLMASQASAQHGCNTAGSGNWFEQSLGDKYNPSAPGTKISGKLTIYYSPDQREVEGGIGVCKDEISREMLNYFVVTLSSITSNASYTTSTGTYQPFSIIESGVCFAADLEYQTQVAIALMDKVVKSMVPGATKWYVKSIANVVEPPDVDPNGCCSGMEFMMMDIVLAVK